MARKEDGERAVSRVWDIPSLAITTRGGSWHLAGGGQGSTSHSAQDSPLQQRIIWPRMSPALRLRNLALALASTTEYTCSYCRKQLVTTAQDLVTVVLL